jgi:hypothetical protein
LSTIRATTRVRRHDQHGEAVSEIKVHLRTLRARGTTRAESRQLCRGFSIANHTRPPIDNSGHLMPRNDRRTYQTVLAQEGVKEGELGPSPKSRGPVRTGAFRLAKSWALEIGAKKMQKARVRGWKGRFWVSSWCRRSQARLLQWSDRRPHARCR